MKLCKAIEGLQPGVEQKPQGLAWGVTPQLSTIVHFKSSTFFELETSFTIITYST